MSKDGDEENFLTEEDLPSTDLHDNDEDAEVTL